MPTPEQRPGADISDHITLSRRGYLGVLAGAGVVGVAGCVGLDENSVSVLAAGSLARTFEDYIGPAFEADTDTAVHAEYFGSNAIMRMVEDRMKQPDVVVSADATLLRDRLYGEFTDWDVEFATNSLGIGYNPDTTLGQRLDDGAPWYEPVRETDDGAIAIGDPDLDPLGYRAVMAFELAEREHDLEGFREEMMAGVESGSRAAAVVYHNMAVDRGMPFVEFPDAYSFGNPDLADHYATVTFTTDEEGYTAEGRPVLYNTTVHNDADEPAAGRRLVQFLVDNPDLLADAGLGVDDSLPELTGDPPEELDI